MLSLIRNIKITLDEVLSALDNVSGVNRNQALINKVLQAIYYCESIIILVERRSI